MALSAGRRGGSMLWHPLFLQCGCTCRPIGSCWQRIHLCPVPPWRADSPSSAATWWLNCSGSATSELRLLANQRSVRPSQSEPGLASPQGQPSVSLVSFRGHGHTLASVETQPFGVTGGPHPGGGEVLWGSWAPSTCWDPLTPAVSQHPGQSCP